MDIIQVLILICLGVIALAVVMMWGFSNFDRRLKALEGQSPQKSAADV